MAEFSYLLHLASKVGEALQARGWRIATAESCTGGGVSAAITAVPGSSNWFEYGLVTYANAAKQHLLGVDQGALANEGAVSANVVRQMVKGVLSLSGAEVAVAISGIAGPGGGSLEKPVGTVWFAWAVAKGHLISRCYHLPGERQEVQRASVIIALEGVLELMGDEIKKPE